MHSAVAVERYADVEDAVGSHLRPLSDSGDRIRADIGHDEQDAAGSSPRLRPAVPSRNSISSFAHSKLCAAIAMSFSLMLRAAPAAAPPSMIAIRLPTGLFDGRAESESA